jgi:hypothetical protein
LLSVEKNRIVTDLLIGEKIPIISINRRRMQCFIKQNFSIVNPSNYNDKLNGLKYEYKK